MEICFWYILSLSLSYVCMKPLCLAQNGEALLNVDGKTYLVVDVIQTGDGFVADTDLETLVLPNGFCQT
uniref:Uncharacterized protein n=1 Tax=Gossypium raimondii TaxID=29730 RepID=A0A0D2RYM0_GOSRA|nr:hypothetical protein B456_006G073700 [Gossypium raimondii]